MLGERENPGWLDVGCGLGYLLDSAFDGGFSVMGLEFNPWAVEQCNKRYAFPVQCGTLDDIPADKRFDVISMIDVIEHFPDPFDQLARARDHLTGNGILLVVTMDCRSWMSRLIGKGLEDFRRIREHLFFFSRPCLTEIISQKGFAVLESRFVGHTFYVPRLIERIAKPINESLEEIVGNWFADSNLAELSMTINPQLKMAIFARNGVSEDSPKNDSCFGPLDEVIWLVFGLIVFCLWAITSGYLSLL
jgi:SAM-dependent methyltransferase